MSTNKMYFNYDNDKSVYVLPVLPEELQLQFKGLMNSVTIDSFGEIYHKNKREGMVVKFTSFFPKEWSSLYCSCSNSEFRSPTAWKDWIIALMDASKPMHFVYTNGPASVNIYAIITSFVVNEKGGDPNALHYSIELKEYRMPKVTKYTKKVTANAVATSTSNVRTNNTASSNRYRVETAGAGLNMRTAPNAGIILCIPDKQVVTSDGTSQSGWLHVQYNGRWGYSYSGYLVKC